MSNAYWELRLRVGRNTIKRTLNATTAEFPVKSKADGWKYWQHGGDIYGEKAVIYDALKRIKPSDTFWDVGSADGGYSAFLGQRCANVVAFEPSSDRIDRLRETLEMNGVEGTIRQHALGSCDGFVRLNEDMSITYTSESQESTDGPNVRRADSVSPNPLPSPDIMKIDTEGAELEVLRGMGDLLNGVRVLYLEPHPDHYHRFDTDWTEVEDLLDNFSFELNPIEVDRVNPLYRATRPE
jgi:FkbM family methyltransferase